MLYKKTFRIGKKGIIGQAAHPPPPPTRWPALFQSGDYIYISGGWVQRHVNTAKLTQCLTTKEAKPIARKNLNYLCTSAIPYIGCWKLYESRLDLKKTCRTVAVPERGPLLANRPLPLFENRAKMFCYVNQVTELGSFNLQPDETPAISSQEFGPFSQSVTRLSEASWVLGWSSTLATSTSPRSLPW